MLSILTSKKTKNCLPIPKFWNVNRSQNDFIKAHQTDMRILFDSMPHLLGMYITLFFQRSMSALKN
jgi:hypothetical protein